jgi:hypothetical protein
VRIGDTRRLQGIWIDLLLYVDAKSEIDMKKRRRVIDMKNRRRKCIWGVVRGAGQIAQSLPLQAQSLQANTHPAAKRL